MFRFKKILKLLVFVALIVLAIRIFFINAYRIPTGSMENTLLAGDFILVNKFIFGASTPDHIPILEIEFPSFRLPRIASPARNDVVVFKLPKYAPAETNSPHTAFIKRIAAGPGDTLQITDNKLYVNGIFIEYPEHAIFDLNRINNRSSFPPDTEWRKDNYGPLKIPRRGDRIELSAENVKMWEGLINSEMDRKAVTTFNDMIMIDGVKTGEYTVVKNYFFMLGDNRNNSADSRFWGFIPEENIMGKAMAVYWSVDTAAVYEKIFDIFTGIRWDRIGVIVN